MIVAHTLQSRMARRTVVGVCQSIWRSGATRLRILAFRLMERALPVKPRRWCFATWPGEYAHTLDNPRAVFEAVKDDPSIEKIILRRREQRPDTTHLEGVNVRAVQMESLLGAYCVATSGCLLIGYSIRGLCSYASFLSARHHIIQLWHGIPLKRIGKLFPGETYWDAETHKYAATVCSSTPDRAFMAQAFAPIPEERVWLTGLPRNSTLLKDERSLARDHVHDLARLRRTLNGRRFILYAPTWRNDSTGLYDFSDDQLASLEQFLSRANAVLGIRAHANRRLTGQDRGHSSIVFVNDYPDVNVVLRLTDVLVTDYSSIYIDFLLLDRPIVHFTYDFEHYVQERGFLYPFAAAIPAEDVATFPELLARMDEALSSGVQDRERFMRVQALFHDHPEDSAAAVAERIRALS